MKRTALQGKCGFNKFWLRLASFVICASVVSLLAPAAHAGLSGCRSDPVVTLSNGVTLDLSAIINDTDTDVQQVAYTVHVPTGISATSVIYTSGTLGPKESVTIYDDNTAGSYTVGTVVTAGTPNVDVTATTQAVSTNGTPSGSAFGIDHQYLRVALSL